MSTLPSLQTIGIVAVAAYVVLYFLYRAALPKPIPGIPYNKDAANHILGDAPAALAVKAKTGSMFDYIPETARTLNSPIYQMFFRPLGRPWVMVVDPYEAHDIRTRRAPEFDRSMFFEELFGVVAPKFHVHMPTGNEWKAHRKLISDTMSTRFLHDVAAPHMWRSTQSVMELWSKKAQLAEGRPWKASEDIYKGALDIVWAGTFGAEMGSAKAQIELLSTYDQIKLPADQDKEVKFPTAKDPADFDSILEIGESEEYATNSLWPKMSHWLALTFLPRLRRAVSLKNRLVTKQLKAAEEKFSKMTEADNDLESNKHFTCALDVVVAREVQMASREGRPINATRQDIRDELFGFMLAGHDTSSTFICWTLKFLTKNQPVQLKLRSALRAAYPRASSSKSIPTISEITSSNIPYLEAIILENSRCGLTVPATIRLTKQDTEILGHTIPKGTDVWLPVSGPGFLSPMIENKFLPRSKGAMDQKEKWGEWEDENIGEFVPERWLKVDEKSGEVWCDENSGPMNGFGSGPRACFGKKWALLEIKIILTLIFWNFELLPTPPELSSHFGFDGVTHRPRDTYVRLKESVL